MNKILLCAFICLFVEAVDRNPYDPRAILLNSVPQLVFKRGEFTIGSGRSKPLPQLNCLYGKACKTNYEPTTVRCKNIVKGSVIEGPILWECTASDLVQGLRLGTTNVVCEGFRHPHDPWVLRGSCALDYILDGSVSSEFEKHLAASHGTPPRGISPEESNWWSFVLLSFLVWFVWRVIASTRVPPKDSLWSRLTGF